MANKIVKLNECQNNYWQEYNVVGDASNVVYNIDNNTPNVESVLTSISDQTIAPGGGYWEDCNNEELDIDFNNYTNSYLCNAGHYYVFVGVLGYDNDILILDLYTAFDVFRGFSEGHVHYQQISIEVHLADGEGIRRPTLFMGACNLFLFIPCNSADNNIVQIITYEDLYNGNIGWKSSVLSYPTSTMSGNTTFNTYDYYKQKDYIIAKGKQYLPIEGDYSVLKNPLCFNTFNTNTRTLLVNNVSGWSALTANENIYQCENFLHDDMIDLIFAYRKNQSLYQLYYINPYSGEATMIDGDAHIISMIRALHKVCILDEYDQAAQKITLYKRNFDDIISSSYSNILPKDMAWEYLIGNDYRLYVVSTEGDIVYGNKIYDQNHIDFILVNQDRDENKEGKKSLKSYCRNHGVILDGQFCTDEDNINIVALLKFSDGTIKLLRTCVDNVI